MALRIDYFLTVMTKTLRLLLVGLLCALVSAGLVGCAALSAHAGVPAVADEVTMPVAMATHGNHGMHGMMEPAEHNPGHDHESEDCDGCGQSLLNRASISLDSGLVSSKLPAPVFIVPTALRLQSPPAAPVRAIWPPGRALVSSPRTLTHEKVSLLI